MFTESIHEQEDLEETLGGRLVAARESEELSTAQLARRMGVKTATLSGWETDRAEPRANQLVTLSGMLNVSPAWLLTGAGEGPSDILTPTDMMQIRAVVARMREKTLAVAAELERLEQRLTTYHSYQK